MEERFEQVGHLRVAGAVPRERVHVQLERLLPRARHLRAAHRAARRQNTRGPSRHDCQMAGETARPRPSETHLVGVLLQALRQEVRREIRRLEIAQRLEVALRDALVECLEPRRVAPVALKQRVAGLVHVGEDEGWCGSSSRSSLG